MAFKSELHSIDAVLNFYEQHDEANYRIYAGASAKPEYCRDEFIGDKESGRQKLEATLMAILENANNTNQYLLQIIKVAKKTTRDHNKPIEFVNVSFQFHFPQGYQASNTILPQATEHSNIFIKKMIETQEQNNALMMRILEKLEATQEVEEVQEVPQNTLGSMLGGAAMNLLNNENIQEMLAAKLIGLLGGTKSSGVVNGVPQDNENDLINLAIERLKKHDATLGQDLNKLADIADNDAGTFNMLLLMLRK